MRVMIASPPGRIARASAAISARLLCIHSSCGAAPGSTCIKGRQHLDQLSRRRVREAHRAADQGRRRAPAAVAQDLVARR